MARKRGTDGHGGSFSQQPIDAVWEKGKVVAGSDPSKKRKDVCGVWIEYNQYGVTTENGTGWEIDHIKPTAKGGTDALSNLQPLQWENNRNKGDSDHWTCP